MNSQFSPGLTETFAHQHHQHLLAEAANARLVLQARPARFTQPSLTLIGRITHPARVPRPAGVAHTQPNPRTAAFIAALTAFLAIQIAVLVAI